MTLQADEQILKCRDDHTPVLFARDGDTTEGPQLFRLNEGATCSWAKPDEPFGSDKLRERIEPGLTALFQSEHFALLVGSGLTHAIHRMATGESLPGMSSSELGVFDAEIAKEIARIALERRLVVSNAQDPVQSHAQTIEKNIGDGVYNKPKLSFIHGAQGRLIGLPSWESGSEQPRDPETKALDHTELSVRIPEDLFHKVQLANQARLASTFDEVVVLLLRKGLAVVSPEITRGLLEQLSEFDQL